MPTHLKDNCLEKTFEKSYSVKCKGNPEDISKLLDESVDVLLRVYKDGKVRVSCYYLSEFTGGCLYSKEGKRKCIYYAV